MFWSKSMLTRLAVVHMVWVQVFSPAYIPCMLHYILLGWYTGWYNEGFSVNYGGVRFSSAYCKSATLCKCVCVRECFQCIVLCRQLAPGQHVMLISTSRTCQRIWIHLLLWRGMSESYRGHEVEAHRWAWESPRWDDNVPYSDNTVSRTIKDSSLM